MGTMTLKAMVAAKIEQFSSDTSAVERGILLLAARQTEDELQTRDTKWKNRSGFASSKAHWGTKAAEVLLAGGRLEGDLLEKATKICLFHVKQIARAEMLGVPVAEVAEVAEVLEVEVTEV